MKFRMVIQTNLNVIRNLRKSLFHLAMLTSIVAAAALTSTVTADDGQLVRKHRPAISFCDDSHERIIGRRLLYISTLDGRLTALDITKGGKLRWSIPTGPGPLISSSIHRLELTNNGQFVRMIPSLSGGIYKFDGESIDPIPITTEHLLSSSSKFSDDLVISGGKETRTYGVCARTGQLLYECSMHGCVNSTDADADAESHNAADSSEEDAAGSTEPDYGAAHDPLLDDVIVVRRQTQTVRAVESRTGVERWNFSVGQHELDLIRSTECHDLQFSEMDMAILDLDVKVIVPEGVICAFSKSDPSLLLWKYKFDHPIVNAWKIGASDELESIDMFGSAQWLWEHDDSLFDTPFPTTSPSIYLGMYQRQLYIQESVNLRREIVDQSNLYTHLTTSEAIMPRIPWRPIAASSNSLVMFQDDKTISGSTLPQNPNDVGVQGNELVPYDEDMFAVSAQSVLNASEYVNGNGFYLYSSDTMNNTEEAICDTDKNLPAIEDTPGANETNHTLNDDLVFNIDDMNLPVKVVIRSLWYWWKEIVVIAFTSAVLLNLIIGQRQRPEREIVVIERHIPVPTAFEATESSTEALLGPATGSSKTISNGLSNGHRSLSESTTHSTDNFVSRFQSDFDLVRCLGRGGFGVVFEAKNKLDDCQYAVKRITLPSKEVSRERVMREVKTLAHCEHQNIVRYFHAWVETPPAGWQEEEDNKWLAHDSSISIQIETPDGTTLPSITSNKPNNRLLQAEKKKQLLSWVSSVNSTACSSDHEADKDDDDDDDDDSCIVFRTESQSLALREQDDSNVVDGDEVDKSKKAPLRKSKSDAISIDIHSNSFDLSLNGNGKNIDYSQLSDSFQIEFVRSANGESNVAEIREADISKTDNKTNGITRRKSRLLSLQLSNEPNNNNNCRDLVPAEMVQNSPKPVQNKAYLYIQMQLCRKESLRDWLREHTTEARICSVGKVGVDATGSIFRQIVDAVEYVHSKGLIHRDLKPSNIFFAPDGRIKIGDFGLVTDMSELPNVIARCGDKSGLPSCARHTQQVGTQLYMAPEQLRGKRYDYKVDIYSLGLVFFELLVYFGTEMERIKTLRELRDARYPKQFPVMYPTEYDLLKRMLAVQPEDRPSTTELKTSLVLAKSRME